MNLIKRTSLFIISFFVISDVGAEEPPISMWRQILVNNSGREVIIVTTKGNYNAGRPYVLKNGQSINFYDSYNKFPIGLSDLNIVVIMNNIVSPDNLGVRNPQDIQNYVEYPSDDQDIKGKLVYTFTESDYQYVLNYGK